MNITVIDGGLYQWDIGRKVVINSDGMEIRELDFSNALSAKALRVDVKSVNGELFADIPNILLQSSLSIKAHAIMVTSDGAYAIFDKEFKVEARVKPSTYMYTETELITVEGLRKDLEELAKNSLKAMTDEEFDDMLNSMNI